MSEPLTDAEIAELRELVSRMDRGYDYVRFAPWLRRAVDELTRLRRAMKVIETNMNIIENDDDNSIAYNYGRSAWCVHGGGPFESRILSEHPDLVSAILAAMKSDAAKQPEPGKEQR